MKCLKPYRPFGKERPDVQFPCGQCRACKVRRTQEWAVRLLHESNSYKSCSFLTLSYDDENLPYDFTIDDQVVPVLNKSDWQLFARYLRRKHNIEKLGVNEKIKYFACGEYGGCFGRPHMHAILYGVAPGEKNRRIIQDEIWKKGLVHLGYVSKDSCRYVAGYVQKKMYGPLITEYYNGIPREFQLVSQGFGLEYARKNEKQLRQQLCVKNHGFVIGIPRYYKKKLGICGDDMSEAIMKSVSSSIDRSAWYHEGDFNKYIEFLDKCAKQRDLDLESLERLYIKR